MSRFIYIGFLICLAVVSLGQASETNDMVRYHKEHRTELVYVSIPNVHYLPGSNIPVRVYLRNPVSKLRSQWSQVIYLALINDEGQSAQEFSLYPASDDFSGSLPISKDLKNGNYLLVAYTNYMKNQPKMTWFSTPVIISDKAVRTPSGKHMISVNSESGSLIAGANNLIIVESNDDQGKNPIDIQGVVLKDKTDTIKNFSTKNGLGGFLLNAQEGSSYHVKSGNKTYPLPAINNSPVISHTLLGNSHLIRVNYNQKKTYKFAIFKDGLAADYRTTVEAGFTLKIPQPNLEEGLYEATLLDEENNVVASRLFYEAKPGDTNLIALEDSVKSNRSSSSFYVRELPAEASVVVSPENNSAENSFKSYLSLNCAIDRPINNINELTLKEINLLLVNRKQVLFNWQDILNYNIPPVKHTAEKSLILKGTLTNEDGELLRNTPFDIDGVYSLLSFQDTTDENGQFETPYLSLVDNERFIFSSNDELVRPTLTTTDYSYFKNNFKYVDYPEDLITKNSKLTEINNWFAKSEEVQIEEQKLYTKADYTVDLNNFLVLNSLEEMIYEYIFAIRVNKRKDGSKKLEVVQGEEKATTEPLILINHQAVHPDMVWELKPTDLDIVEVLYARNQNLRYLGPYYTGGLVSFFISEERFKEINPEPHFIEAPYTTLAKRSEISAFELPDYAPDLNTNLLIDYFPTENTFNVTTGDIDGTYIITVTGFDKNGNPIEDSAKFTNTSVE